MIPVYKPYIPKNLSAYVQDAINSTWISSTGPYLNEATEMLQNFLGVKHVLLCNNGTSATHLVAKALNRKFNPKEIIIPNNVYVAAINSFLFDGFNQKCLKPVDADLSTWNYSLDYLDEAISPGAAVLIVHNIGNIINVPKLKRKYPHTVFVEDNCEGFCGKYEGKYSGTESFASSISFYGNKIITCGEGGAFITNDSEVFDYIKCVHGQGQSATRFLHRELGVNYRMTNVQAAMLKAQLEDINFILENKKRVFNYYCNLVNQIPTTTNARISRQFIEEGTEHSTWMFGVKLDSCVNISYSQIEYFFKNHGIEIRPMFYSICDHNHLSHLPGNYYVADELHNSCFILPSFPELKNSEIEYIVEVLNKLIRLLEKS